MYYIVKKAFSFLLPTFIIEARVELSIFNAQRIAQLKEDLPDFDIRVSSDVAGHLPVSVQEFLEFYGFYDTLKALACEFYIGATECELEGTSDRVATYLWRCQKAKGTVVLLHGLFDHVGLFLDLIEHCLKQGYCVLAVDLPGHGLSSGEPTVVASFKHYGRVVQKVLATVQAYIPRPFYGVGQSTGASVLMSMSFETEKSEQATQFQSLVFLGPLVRPRQWWAGRLAFKLFGNILTSIGRDFSSPNSHNEEFCHFLRYQDPLQARQLSVCWVAALNEWVEGFEKQPVVATPLLVIQGTGDGVVDWKYNVEAIERRFSHCQVHYIEGAMHHLANEGEAWRKVVFSSLSQFLKRPFN